jgi:hypothetical protein
MVRNDNSNKRGRFRGHHQNDLNDACFRSF